MYQVIRIEHTDGWGMFRWNDKTGERYTIGDHLTEINGYANEQLNYYQVQLYNTTSDATDSNIAASYNVPRHINVYAHIHLPSNKDYDLTTNTLS